jgi:hypothetical protein
MTRSENMYNRDLDYVMTSKFVLESSQLLYSDGGRCRTLSLLFPTFFCFKTCIHFQHVLLTYNIQYSLLQKGMHRVLLKILAPCKTNRKLLGRVRYSNLCIE